MSQWGAGTRTACRSRPAALLGDTGQGPSPLWASVSPLGLQVSEGCDLQGSLLWEPWAASLQDERLESPALSTQPAHSKASGGSQRTWVTSQPASLTLQLHICICDDPDLHFLSQPIRPN